MMRPRWWRKSGRVILFGALGSTLLTLLLGAGLALVAGSAGCYGDQCVGSDLEFGDKEGEGHLVTTDIWESHAQSAKWLRYSPKRRYFLRLHGFEGRKVFRVITYVSPDESPNGPQPGTQFTVAGGNLAEVKILETPPGEAPRVVVANDTCADYYARFEVQAYPSGPVTDAGPPDAGDAGTGANLDASSDTGAE
ncbi:hypothetical protein [Pendulispora albinea]|uniref:Uncharacterized protein n=1 Tax=Pendulispora albinea TaxID=2741071 RepID=A0ABZ2M4V3_9BACT